MWRLWTTMTLKYYMAVIPIELQDTSLIVSEWYKDSDTEQNTDLILNMHLLALILTYRKYWEIVWVKAKLTHISVVRYVFHNLC